MATPESSPEMELSQELFRLRAERHTWLQERNLSEAERLDRQEQIRLEAWKNVQQRRSPSSPEPKASLGP